MYRIDIDVRAIPDDGYTGIALRDIPMDGIDGCALWLLEMLQEQGYEVRIRKSVEVLAEDGE